MTFGLLREHAGNPVWISETVALRECAVCEGYGWFGAASGR